MKIKVVVALTLSSVWGLVTIVHGIYLASGGAFEWSDLVILVAVWGYILWLFNLGLKAKDVQRRP